MAWSLPNSLHHGFMSADLVEIVESLHVSEDDSAEIHSHLIPKEFIQCMN